MPAAREYRALLNALFTRPASIEVLLAMGTPGRFGEVRTRIPGLSSKTLASSLRFLTEQGMVEPEPIPGLRSRSLYRLTEKGAELAAVLRVVTELAGDHRDVAPSVARREVTMEAAK